MRLFDADRWLAFLKDRAINDEEKDFAKKVEDMLMFAPTVGSEDLISRQALLEQLHTRFTEGFDEDIWWNSTHVMRAVNDTPSLRPECCVSCKHYDSHDHRCKYFNHGTSKDDYCSHIIF